MTREGSEKKDRPNEKSKKKFVLTGMWSSPGRNSLKVSGNYAMSVITRKPRKGNIHCENDSGRAKGKATVFPKIL